MGYYDKNIESNPAAFGLAVVAEIEYSGGSYEFDTRIVWADKDGVLYTARDSGCSCPTPFEDYRKLEDLERVNLTSLKNETANELAEGFGGVSATTVRDFLTKVEDAVLNPTKYAFNVEAHAKAEADRKERANIGDGLREAAKFLQLNPYGIRTSEIIDHVWRARELSVAQVHTLGVYLANVAGQQRDGE